MIRSLCLSLIPSIARESPSVQVILVCLVLLVSSNLQTYLLPWRAVLANVIDAAMSIVVSIMLICGSLSTVPADAASSIGTAAMVCFELFFVFALVGVGLSLYKRFFARPWFDWFLCHHKGGASGQVRYLQLQLLQQAQVSVSVFIDSDFLQNLDLLFEIVRLQVKYLVGYLTAETLQRPCCAGDIAVAHRSHGRLLAVHTPSFVPPTNDQLEPDKMHGFLAEGSKMLERYGLRDGRV